MRPFKSVCITIIIIVFDHVLSHCHSLFTIVAKNSKKFIIEFIIIISKRHKYNKMIVLCNECKQVVTNGVTYKNEYYHRQCFACVKCRKCLAGERFFSRQNRPFCCECYEEVFAEKCAACDQRITGIGDIFFIFFDQRRWHSECFVCVDCNKSLLGELAVKAERGITCTNCADRCS